jgi:high-affinity Fe2+/Pb2+ permease
MLQALIIVFREGFESFLTVAIIFAYLKKTGRDWLRPAVWWGIVIAVVASAGLGYWLQSVNQPLWEGITALVAAVLVASFVVHIWRVAPRMKRDMEARIEARASHTSTAWAWVGIFILTVLMITREGMETALLLIQVRQGNFWLGCAMGALVGVGALRPSHQREALLPGHGPLPADVHRAGAVLRDPRILGSGAAAEQRSHPSRHRALLLRRPLQPLDHVRNGRDLCALVGRRDRGGSHACEPRDSGVVEP